MKKVTVIPVVEGALDATSTDFAKYDAAIGVDMKNNMHKKQTQWGQQRF